MLPEGYVALGLNGEKAYVRKDKFDQLRMVAAVIFDCDGVLVDIRNSYNRAISKAVAFILKGLTGQPLPESLVSNDVIFLFRKTGGFNNDWDTVYGILMFLLSSLPEKIRGKLGKRIKAVAWQRDPFERFSSAEEAAEKNADPAGLGFIGFSNEMVDDLKRFTELLDATGAASVDRSLAGKHGASPALVDFHKTLKRFLCYPAGVDQSIISRVFEEFFCGPTLFLRTYGVKPKFYRGRGMVENEKLVIRHETLERLAALLGEANLGIASGSRFEPAKYVLGDLLERLNPEALVFLETIERAEHEQSTAEGLMVNLKKPHPFSLLRAAEAFGFFDCALYVGDSMEDALMAQEAKKLRKPFLFAGVYRYSGLEEALKLSFLESGCDMVIPSVNELPLVLEAFRRGRK